MIETPVEQLLHDSIVIGVKDERAVSGWVHCMCKEYEATAYTGKAHGNSRKVHVMKAKQTSPRKSGAGEKEQTYM
jgi:hypothetical protein